ncbi:hypothetical protein CORC01_05796 [Colletotrichum orchidophilum]|uniref:Uncharacterized protein n=1 Tax=Colletotrichum orchidophilum TaxID=1209926 RepID=A0A1G4BBV7_9PEZI|nr:uncharacterized protein CORC01_05796 [Colletotrichum orchidophilum]OHE98900.1 hypothetical protein CORC01_05796 [Colletotrichum orchidophilum]
MQPVRVREARPTLLPLIRLLAPWQHPASSSPHIHDTRGQRPERLGLSHARGRLRRTSIRHSRQDSIPERCGTTDLPHFILHLWGDTVHTSTPRLSRPDSRSIRPDLNLGSQRQPTGTQFALIGDTIEPTRKLGGAVTTRWLVFWLGVPAHPCGPTAYSIGISQSKPDIYSANRRRLITPSSEQTDFAPSTVLLISTLASHPLQPSLLAL